MSFSCLRAVALLLWLLTAGALHAQELSYTNYNTRDGLAGAGVYSIVQDREGFIWIGTETGLSRFDGNHFRNFTVADGLPSNEVLGMFVDSRDRLWIISFQNAICYYRNGRIHNQQNDPLLRRISFRSQPYAVIENEQGDILIRSSKMGSAQAQDDYWVITGNDRLRYFQGEPRESRRVNRHRLTGGAGAFSARLSGLPDYICRQVSSNFNYLLPQKGAPGPAYYLQWHDSLVYFNGRDTVAHVLKVPSGVYAVTNVDNGLFSFLRFQSGVQLLDFSNSTFTTYLPEQIVQYVFRDAEQNLWFCTKGSGVFRLSNSRFRNYRFDHLAARDVRRLGGRIYIGTDNGYLWSVPPAEQLPADLITAAPPRQEHADITAVYRRGRQAYINYANSNFYNVPMPPKTIQLYGDTALFASISGTYRLHLPDMKQIDRIYSERNTCAYQQQGVYYIGTVRGLYKVVPGKPRIFLGDSSILFRYHISCITESADGTLWIGTYGSGVTGYRNGRIIASIRRANGLVSDICRCLYAEGNTLWAGTDKGLNKIAIDSRTVLRKFTESDGLGSDVINTVYSEGPYVYAGTTSGLSIFDESKVPVHSLSNLVLNDVTVSGKAIDPSVPAQLRHRDNNIRFGYSGISFLSGADILYKYRLRGLSDQWQLTRENMLSYPSLPSGSYALQLIAVNKFGDPSRMVEYRFSIRPLLWERLWFQLAMLALVIGLTAWIARLSIRRSSRKEKERLQTEQKIMELEQMALRAQMNPHFIFNCLNSMQRFILKHDVRSTNFYLSRFAGLVRQTLDNSTRVYISVEEEVAYLKNYLELERLQLAEHFGYEISVDPAIDREQVQIPNMVLQPYIENAVKHGVRHLDEGGFISVRFRIRADAQLLECTIEDNGRGMTWTQAARTLQPAGHQSKGLSITDQRIRTLNQLRQSGRDIRVTLEDIRPPDGAGVCGTRVIICFPL